VAAAPEDPWSSYERTVVEILRPGRSSLRVRAAPEVDQGSWPWPDRQPVHLLTAWDPGLERLGVDVNRMRQATLRAELGLLSGQLLVAIGVDSATGRREEGVAVRGVPEAEILALGVRYGQDAVFAWTPAQWVIVACQGGRRLATGWSLVVPDPGFRFSPASDTPI
jgi:hypothetical protein